MSMNGALVRHTYPDAHLGRGIGLNGLVVAISAAIAPSLAAGILAVGPWPWLFAVNVPFGLLNLWLARASAALRDLPHRPFDWTSALLSAAMFGLFFVGADALTRDGAACRPALRASPSPSPPGVLPGAARRAGAGAAYPGRPLPHPGLRPLGERLDLRLRGLRHRLRGAALLFPVGARPRPGRDRAC